MSFEFLQPLPDTSSAATSVSANAHRRTGQSQPCRKPLDGWCRSAINAGLSLHWLRPFSKAPVEADWSKVARKSAQQLIETYRPGSNIGVRLGEVSSAVAGYLHLIDLDIRDAEQADDAWDRLRSLWPDVDDFPMVISGSGGESRHVYFFTEKPFSSRKLAKSDGLSMVFDPEKGREVRKNDWEIELFGTGKQAVLPPSIHPDSLLPYLWEREIDTAMLDLGIGPSVSAEVVESWGAHESDSDVSDDEDDLIAIVRASPMGLSEDEIDKTVANLPRDWVEDRDTWVQVGAALHHEYEGAQKGFDRWCDWSKDSTKFDMKTQKAVWKSFRGAKNPVRMATLIQAAGRNRLAQDHDWMDDLIGVAPATLPAVIDNDLADLLGDSPPAPARKKPDLEWRSLLQLTEEGEVKSTLPNLRLIVANDPRTFGIVAQNDFKNQPVLRRQPGSFKINRESPKPVKQLVGELWTVKDPVNGDHWNVAHDNFLRDLLESAKRQGGYDLKITDRDLTAAVGMAAITNRYHPVREYLLKCHADWDGIPRVETLFIDYLVFPT